MAKFKVIQKIDRGSFGRWHYRWVIYKKRWYGWSWQAEFVDIDELTTAIKNLMDGHNIVYKHWTVTKPLNIE